MLDWITNLPPLPPRPEAGHKGTFGTVVVVGGSATMPGAPALCATAALRGGAGLAKIAAPPEVLPAALSFQPSATGLGLDQLASFRDDPKNVLAVGPGLGQNAEVFDRVERLLAWPNPMVLDADGLNALAARGLKRSAGLPWVLTPHPGEFRRLAACYGISHDPIDPETRPAAAKALAQATSGVVVLKGQHTIVTDGRRGYRNETGNAALATAGTGDVLTGLIAGLIAQGSAVFEASVIAAWVHGRVADHWTSRHGSRGLLAMELADGVPPVLNEMSQTAAADL